MGILNTWIEFKQAQNKIFQDQITKNVNIRSDIGVSIIESSDITLQHI